MTNTFKQVRTSYDRLVAAYAARNDTETPSKLLPLLEQLVEAVGTAGRILDVGCGTAREMAWLESRGAAVCGIDSSIGMLTHARSKVTGDLLAMNMKALAFRTGSFDGVWCCASLLHLPKVEAVAAFSEIHRVLKRNGTFVLIVQAGTGEGWEESYVENAPRYFARYAKDELTQVVDRNGFEVNDMGITPGRDCNWLACVCSRR